MANPEDEGKTEQPTERRVSQAHEEGQFAISQEAKTAFALLGITATLVLVLPGMLSRLQAVMRPFIERPHEIAFGAADLQTVFVNVLGEIALVLALPFGLVAAAALGAAYMQTGLQFTIKKLKPDFGKINPMSGLKRMFAAQQLVELAKGIAKILIVGIITWAVVVPMLPHVHQMPEMSLLALLDYVDGIIIKMVVAVLVLVIIVAGADYWWQHHEFHKNIRMTKQEIKDEYKQTEGDPLIKGKIRQLRAQRARQRMMAAVPNADVVVMNPTHFAVALKYDMDAMGAPMCVAKGQDLIALKIREIAQANDVAVVENPPLARALYASVEIDQEVPPEQYKAVAEVISYVFRLKGKLRNN